MTGLDPAMFDLFREETRTQTSALGRGLIELEFDPGNAARIEPLMRAAHSLKGAARILGIDEAVRLAHAMEDALVAAQQGKVRIGPADVDALLQGSDLLAGLGELAGAPGINDWTDASLPMIDRLEPIYRSMAEGKPAPQQNAPSARGLQPTIPAQSDKSPLPESQPSREIEPPPAFGNTLIPTAAIVPSEDQPLFDLFREEVRAHLLGFQSTLRHLTDPIPPLTDALECLRQLRGAALIMNCEPIASWCAVLTEVCQGLGHEDGYSITPLQDWIRYGMAIIVEILDLDEEGFTQWNTTRASVLAQAGEVLRSAIASPTRTRTVAQSLPPEPANPNRVAPEPTSQLPTTLPDLEPGSLSSPEDAVVRVTAQSLNRLMGLAGESLVQARWLNHFSSQLLHLKKRHDALATELDSAFHAIAVGSDRDSLAQVLTEVRRHARECRKELHDQTNDFDEHAARAEDLNSRLYREVIVSRMRPFADGIHGLPRLVRDMARSLGKQARLDVEGETTDVDRDVLERLEAPLSHLIRNAVDHGLEIPDERSRAGKPVMGTIRLHAGHRAGMLSVTVSDDGRGIDLDRLRRRIVKRGLTTTELVSQMGEVELLEFLFLPGFTTTEEVTEYSGRGVGLDVVQTTIRRIGGSVRITTQVGVGTSFHLQLPITLSVIRAVVVEIAGESFAFPHTRIDRLLRIHRSEVKSIEHRQFITVDDQHIGLVIASQLLALQSEGPRGAELPVVLLSDTSGLYGLVVDAFRGEQDLVVRPLDPRLGKVADVSAAAILDNGAPVLIVDVEDLLRSMDQFIQTGTLRRCEVRESAPTRKKRILVVDDSITVREVERQLLTHLGYDVFVAVDGMDGWNQVRSGKFDLVVSDIDMPRMDGIQLVRVIRSDDQYRDLPVVIVSYKEREEDRTRGLEVGANAYLTKSSFHDNGFVQAIQDLIGPP